jgi:1-acyl-sn-glycerol-3-phosphate acyltransferase
MSLEQPIPFAGGTYKTKPGKQSIISRLFTTAIFYIRLIWIVFRASRRAKRSRYGDEGWAMSSFEVFEALEKAGVKFEITGVENYRQLEGPCVFIGNHMSMLETFILPVIIEPYKDTTFIVKKSLIDYPVFRYVMRSRDPIVVSRDDPREDLKTVFEDGGKILASGRSIVVFPQKTRTPVFNPEEFNTIGLKLAKKANVPVIPIALKTDAWGNGNRLKDFGKIDPSKKVWFHFGKPMTIKIRGVEEHAEIIAFIQEHLEKWKGNN